MFKLDAEELQNWKSQFVISNSSAKMGIRKPPYAFTEQGVAMLSSVLNSKKAIQANISIMRAFVKLRELGAQNRAILRKLGELEKRVDGHDNSIGRLIDAIREEVLPGPKKIGFTPEARARR
jgi:hypothetical protein